MALKLYDRTVENTAASRSAWSRWWWTLGPRPTYEEGVIVLTNTGLWCPNSRRDRKLAKRFLQSGQYRSEVRDGTTFLYRVRE